LTRREALAALVALPAIDRIAVAEVKPDAVIVVECPKILSLEHQARVRDTIEKIWPGRRAIVLCDGMKLRITEP
jgi:hypothetical protein